MRKYKALNKHEFEFGEYKLTPIRHQDRFDIMKWRNEQIYHLRQSSPLTEEVQDKYFNEVISNLFNQELPNQLLFSFLKNDKCIGYGGLVHINWIDKNAEISFIMDTSLEAESFKENWTGYLKLIEKVAFDELNLHKIYTYAFDLRPHLYNVLELAGYIKEAVLKEHCFFENQYIDIIIHRKIGFCFELASIKHLDITFKWASDSTIRKYSFNQHKIEFGEHENWFLKTIDNPQSKYFICKLNNVPIGSFKVDINKGVGMISFLIDSNFHGQGFGRKLVKAGIEQLKKLDIKINYLNAKVIQDNIASMKIFESLNFTKSNEVDYLLYSLKL